LCITRDCCLRGPLVDGTSVVECPYPKAGLRKSRKPHTPHLGQSRPWERARLTPRRGLMHKASVPLLGVEKWLPEVEEAWNTVCPNLARTPNVTELG